MLKLYFDSSATYFPAAPAAYISEHLHFVDLWWVRRNAGDSSSYTRLEGRNEDEISFEVPASRDPTVYGVLPIRQVISQWRR